MKINLFEVRRLRDLPEEERSLFREWLRGQTAPAIEDEPPTPEHQDGYYYGDYLRWKSGRPPPL